jgi:hypothetical protein
MKLSIILFVTTAVLGTHSVKAETLLAPSFPGSSPWVLASVLPIKSNDGETTSEVKNFYPATENRFNPKNIVSITTVSNLSRNVGAVEYLTLLAQGLQEKCESMRATRPALLLEKRTPVSYARLYCSKVKGTDFGVIQTIKVLQGKNNTFAVFREWHVPPFDFEVTPSDKVNFANRLFLILDDAATWLQQMASAEIHLTSQVFLCAEKQGEFGEPCPSK